MLEDKTLSQKRGIIYILGFLFTLSHAIPTYINSSFLASFLPEGLVGIVYTASSIVALAAFIEMPRFLRRFGNLKLALLLLSLCLLSLIGLVSGLGVMIAISAFILNFVAIALINFCVDIFLESFSPDSKTGSIRGAYLSMGAVAWLVSPVLASFILQEIHFSYVYMASALMLLPVISLMLFQLRDFKDPQYSRTPFWKSIVDISGDKDIKSILFAQVLLQFFYAWMVIYAPLYLHQYVGFEWDTIGFILSFMLIPFLFESWWGKLADAHGEKKLLSLGFIIMGVATIATAFVTNGNPFVWAGILFVTRIGASIAETMIEAYFFKKVDASKSHLIGFSRMARPFAYVLGPVVATLLFTVADMKTLFIVLGFVMLYGLRYSLAIRDTPPSRLSA
ncbi:MAG: MFS transporter [bacterium]|nr:MFS transporter [bacterium]